MASSGLKPSVSLRTEGSQQQLVDSATRRSLLLSPLEARLLGLWDGIASAAHLTDMARAQGAVIEARQAAVFLERLSRAGFLAVTPTIDSGLVPDVPGLERLDDPAPALRGDLAIDKPKGTKGVLQVTDPLKGRSFTLYDFEVSIARLLDGKRTAGQVIDAAERIGIPVTLESLRKFVRQLRGYRFIDERTSSMELPAVTSAVLNHVDKPAVPDAWTQELRELYDSAQRFWRLGKPEQALEYLEALLGVSPALEEPLELKARIEAEREGAGEPKTDLNFDSLHGTINPLFAPPAEEPAPSPSPAPPRPSRPAAVSGLLPAPAPSPAPPRPSRPTAASSAPLPEPAPTVEMPVAVSPDASDSIPPPVPSSPSLQLDVEDVGPTVPNNFPSLEMEEVVDSGPALVPEAAVPAPAASPRRETLDLPPPTRPSAPRSGGMVLGVMRKATGTNPAVPSPEAAPRSPTTADALAAVRPPLGRRRFLAIGAGVLVLALLTSWLLRFVPREYQRDCQLEVVPAAALAPGRAGVLGPVTAKDGDLVKEGQLVGALTDQATLTKLETLATRTAALQKRLTALAQPPNPKKLKPLALKAERARKALEKAAAQLVRAEALPPAKGKAAVAKAKKALATAKVQVTKAEAALEVLTHQAQRAKVSAELATLEAEAAKLKEEAADPVLKAPAAGRLTWKKKPGEALTTTDEVAMVDSGLWKMKAAPALPELPVGVVVTATVMVGEATLDVQAIKAKEDGLEGRVLSHAPLPAQGALLISAGTQRRFEALLGE